MNEINVTTQSSFMHNVDSHPHQSQRIFQLPVYLCFMFMISHVTFQEMNLEGSPSEIETTKLV